MKSLISAIVSVLVLAGCGSRENPTAVALFERKAKCLQLAQQFVESESKRFIVSLQAVTYSETDQTCLVRARWNPLDREPGSLLAAFDETLGHSRSMEAVVDVLTLRRLASVGDLSGKVPNFACGSLGCDGKQTRQQVVEHMARLVP